MSTDTSAWKTQTTQKEEVPQRPFRICRAIAANGPFNAAMLAINIWAFVVSVAQFGGGFLSRDDLLVQISTVVCLSIFAIEFVVDHVARPGYACSFFFWLDFISILSLLLITDSHL